jgi:hypothetical protein
MRSSVSSSAGKTDMPGKPLFVDVPVDALRGSVSRAFTAGIFSLTLSFSSDILLV